MLGAGIAGAAAGQSTLTAPPASATATASTADPSPVGAVLRARVGEPVPDIVLPDLTGAPRSLTELRGRRAMLHVFASW